MAEIDEVLERANRVFDVIEKELGEGDARVRAELPPLLVFMIAGHRAAASAHFNDPPARVLELAHELVGAVERGWLKGYERGLEGKEGQACPLQSVRPKAGSIGFPRPIRFTPRVQRRPRQRRKSAS